jgi:hypothetical protein
MGRAARESLTFVGNVGAGVSRRQDIALVIGRWHHRTGCQLNVMRHRADESGLAIACSVLIDAGIGETRWDLAHRHQPDASCS